MLSTRLIVLSFHTFMAIPKAPALQMFSRKYDLERIFYYNKVVTVYIRFSIKNTFQNLWFYQGDWFSAITIVNSINLTVKLK